MVTVILHPSPTLWMTLFQPNIELGGVVFSPLMRLGIDGNDILRCKPVLWVDRLGEEVMTDCLNGFAVVISEERSPACFDAG